MRIRSRRKARVTRERARRDKFSLDGHRYTGFIGYGRVVTRTRRGHGSFHTQRLLTRGNGEASDGEGATG